MTRTAVAIIGVALAVAAAATLLVPSYRVLAQMPMHRGGPMMDPGAMPQHQAQHAQMTASIRALRAQLGRVPPAALTPTERAMYDYLKLLQAHLESMHAGMPAAPGVPSQPPQPQLPGARTITVEAVDFAFRPSEIRVAAGTSLNLLLRNRGAVTHDLEVPALRLHLHAEPRTQAAGSLRALAAGTYEFYCTIPGHREAGMRGQITVIP